VKRSDHQAGFIKLLVVIALLAGAIYVGIQFGMPYYRYQAFKNEVKDIARLELGQTERTKAQILEAAKGLKIPIEEENLIVMKKEKSVRVQTEWSETVDVYGLYQDTLHFKIDVEE
jgi:hypothetical protein